MHRDCKTCAWIMDCVEYSKQIARRSAYLQKLVNKLFVAETAAKFSFSIGV